MFRKLVRKFKAYWRTKNRGQHELKRLSEISRYTMGETHLLGNSLSFVDSASFLFIYDELFNKQIYKFRSDNNFPYIIDCGANIGLSIIYFKRLFPNAIIIGFEPDKKVFDVLKFNVQSFGLFDVELIEASCWNEETVLKFYSEGADAGRRATNSETESITKVRAIRLKEYLSKPIDFLKIDIEGAEAAVLDDCKDVLANVKNIFVEYHSFVDVEQKLPEILSILKNSGFRLHITAPGLTSPTPLVEVNRYLGMDNQVNIYGIR